MDLFGVNLENYKKFFALQSKSRKKGVKSWVRDQMNKLRTATNIYMVEQKKMAVSCKAGTLMGVMYEKGDVYPCELLNRKPLGNVREFDYDFEKLWTSTRTKEASKWIKDTKCYCTHECFQRFNIIYKPGFVAAELAKNMLGKSEIMNTLKHTEEHKNHGGDLIQLGKIRGVRVAQEAPVMTSSSATAVKEDT